MTEMQELAAARAEALAARAARAAGVLRERQIEPLSGERWRVRSADGRREYAVRAGYCSCPDFAWRGEVPCKHQIAVEVLERWLHRAA